MGNIGNMHFRVIQEYLCTGELMVIYYFFHFFRNINPYWQIMENSSRNFSEIFIFRVVTQAVLLENSSNFFFEISILGRHTGRFIGKLIH